MMYKELKQLAKDELYSLILDLIRLNGENAKFVEFKLKNNVDEALEYHKDKVRKTLFENQPNLRGARKVISNFKKLSSNPKHLLELMTFYVELGVQLGEQYGDMYDSFYSSMETVFESCVSLLNKNPSLIGEFKPQLQDLIGRSNEGWSHKDRIEGIYEGLK